MLGISLSLVGQLKSTAAAVAFSPIDLFATGSQGIWLDPSDLTTMFSDRAGTTPVTTPGTTVGLRLDKSKGLVLGAELVGNSTFDSGITGWNNFAPARGTLSWNSTLQRLRVDNTAGTGDAYIWANTAVTAGSRYRISLNQYIVSGTASVSRVKIYWFNGTGAVGSVVTATTIANDALSIAVLAPSGATSILIGSDATAIWEIDNISVRELPGNHAVAPTDAARPTYGIEPKGGRRNLLTWSEDFGNAVWAKTSTTVPATQYTAPDGTVTADALIEAASASTHSTQSDVTAVSGATYALSVYAKPAGRSYIDVSLRNLFAANIVVRFTLSGAGSSVTREGSPAAQAIQSVGDGWYRCTVAGLTTSAGSMRGQFFLALDATGSSFYTGDGTSGIYLWGAQLELGSTATAYQRVTTAYEVTESGVATCHYVQYDGSDDSMSTAAIDFTATDKMSVFAGVRVIGASAGGMIAEISVDIGASNGAWNLVVPNASPFGGRGFRSKGTIQGAADVGNSTYTAPITQVLSGLGDISGDLATLRIDGAQVAQSTADQGGGNFGNYPLFIGRRNNSTLPFNGRDYGIVVVGKAASAGEITDTETWLAAKTAQVTL